jgi:bacteriocin-like protein
MKKTTRKLMLRKVIVRELSEQELTHVIGGLETDTAAPYPYSAPRQCTSGLVATLDVPRDGD